MYFIKNSTTPLEIKIVQRNWKDTQRYERIKLDFLLVQECAEQDQLLRSSLPPQRNPTQDLNRVCHYTEEAKTILRFYEFKNLRGIHVQTDDR